MVQSMFDHRFLRLDPYADGRTGAGVPLRDRPQEPDPQWWLDAWRAGTEQARRRTAEVRLDISYGARESDRLDLYQPGHRVGQRPFAAFVHGGAGRWAMRDEAGFPAKAVHRRGAVFIAIGFDTAPGVALATRVDQVCRAWRYLGDNAERLGLDPARGHLLGHGPGAYLAARAAFDPRSRPPVSAVLLSGRYEAGAPWDQQPDAAAEAAAPLGAERYVRRLATAIVVAWGEREHDASCSESLSFARACRARVLDVTQGVLPGRGHLATSLELADPHSRVLASIRSRG